MLKKFRPDSDYGALRVGNIVDVLDIYANKWREGRILQVNDNNVVVHYKGMANKYDETIEKNEIEEKIKSVQLQYAKSKKKGPLKQRGLDV